MSLNLIRKNSNSPFQLQRSMVAQGDENGAYSQGGYNPEAVYDSSGIAAGIAAFGESVGAGFKSISEGDKNKMNVKKKERLEKRQQKIVDKKIETVSKDIIKGSDSSKKQDRLTKRFDRIQERKEKTQGKINSYEEKQKLLGRSITGEEED